VSRNEGREQRSTRPIVGLAFWLVISLAAGWVGSLFPPGPWYEGLVKPAWNPPNWIFAPVWTTLYLLMAIAAWLVWRRDGFAGAQPALGLFVLQLLFNALWSYLFFGLQRPGLAFAEILLLWGAIAATAWAFRGHSRAAALLMVPYLAWVSFAALLNFAIWRLNG
jgi:tryptophan-rich sensory protein